MNEREAFLRALDANEDELTTRLVYADWLDERGEHEEADRQRKWPAAKAWLVEFCKSLEPDRGDSDAEMPDDQNPYSFFGITYPKLVELGRRAVAGADDRGVYLFCGANETMMDALRANTREFWKNWSIVTGVPLPPGTEEKSYFSCSC